MAIDPKKDYTKIDFPEYEAKFRAKLEKSGLSPIQVDIMILKFVYDYDSFSEIARKLGIIGTLTAIRLYNEAANLLKHRGFDE